LILDEIPPEEDAAMKCFCFSDWDEKKLDHMSASERESFIKSCFACVDIIRKGGILMRAKPLENPRGVKNVRRQSRRLCITDGPFPETKEQLGGNIIRREGRED
jgi:hypothetical protein